jgi:hypothetical protein
MGYTSPALGTGSFEGAGVSLSSGYHRYSGNIRTFLRVGDPFDKNNNLVVGIRDNGAGPQLYIEDSGNFVVPVHSVSAGPSYAVYLTHNSSTNSTQTWTAEWDVGQLKQTYRTTLGGTASATSFIAHTETSNSTCNQFVAGFGSITPWSLSQMDQYNNSSGIYLVNPLPPSQFTVYGPNF